MRLTKAKVSGYKRLAQESEIDLGTDPVCVVGPNAAGKSSFLDALVHLNKDAPFTDAERTRLPNGGRLNPRVEVRFELTPAERKLLAGTPEAKAVRQIVVRTDGGDDECEIDTIPFAERDLRPRLAMGELLEHFAESDWYQSVVAIEAGLEPVPDPSLEAALADARTFTDDDHEYMEEDRGPLAALGRRLAGIRAELARRTSIEEAGDTYSGPDWRSLPSAFADLEGRLEMLFEHEGKPHPDYQAGETLRPLVPKFLKFDAPARKLEARYILNEERPADDYAVHNFLALAGTNWEEAAQVAASGDKGRRISYLEERERLLRKRAALKWDQSKIDVKLDIEGWELTIVLSMQADDWITLDAHSDGLKQFMALRAFIWKESEEVRPIVLLDEADQHLHYDAQADMVGVFEEQKEAAKIIYTTHSAGCLPRDLGLGIRAIVPETEESNGKTRQKDHSEIINRFWTEGRTFSPLLLAMGAGAFAFSATQRALVTEGMSDALLLPTLLREATGKRHLRFQAVPSVAEATNAEVANFDLIAGRVGCLLDGDEGGRNHRKRLLRHGFHDEQIVFLGGGGESGLAIEDFLDGDVYLKAVNHELKLWHQLTYPREQLPEIGRAAAIEKWCEARSKELGEEVDLSKVDVAQHILDQKGSRKAISDPRQKAALKELHKAIEDVFDGAPERMRQLHQASKRADRLEREARDRREAASEAAH